MYDEHLSLAKKNSYELDDSRKDPGLSNSIYKDEELVRRAQNDDPWAIEQLILRYQKKVYAIAYQMLSGDEQEAQDRTQDAFLKAFRKIKQFKGNRIICDISFSSFLKVNAIFWHLELCII